MTTTMTMTAVMIVINEVTAVVMMTMTAVMIVVNEVNDDDDDDDCADGIYE